MSPPETIRLVGARVSMRPFTSVRSSSASVHLPVAPDEVKLRELLRQSAQRERELREKGEEAREGDWEREVAGGPVDVRIETSALKRGPLASPRASSTGDAASESPLRSMSAHLRSLITLRGPLTVARYMRECLTHPTLGYYTTRSHVLGGRGRGDFVTSPELSQLFGELLALWAVSVWQRLGEPARVLLVELGPGTGALQRDVLRAARKFPRFYRAIELHLVEVSPVLRRAQGQAIGAPYPETATAAPAAPKSEGAKKPPFAWKLPPPSVEAAKAHRGVHEVRVVTGERTGLRMPAHEERSDAEGDTASASPPPLAPSVFGEGVWAETPDGLRVCWHDVYGSVPHDAPQILLAQEFLDALPVHQFEYVRDVGWRERLVDVDSNGALRLVLARGATFTSESLPKRVLPAAYTPQEGELCEACPDALAVAQVVAQRLAAQRGAALFVDYGTTSALQCSLRAIKEHAFVDPFVTPGEADLSCMVDFNAFKVAAQGVAPQVEVHGPISQRALLTSLGSDARLVQLLQRCEDEAKAHDIITRVERLTAESEEGMGGVYKALALAHWGTASSAPTELAGFDD